MNLYYQNLLFDENFYPEFKAPSVYPDTKIHLSKIHDTEGIKFDFRNSYGLITYIRLDTMSAYCGALYLSTISNNTLLDSLMPHIFRVLELGGYTRAYCQLPGYWKSNTILEKWGWKRMSEASHKNIRTGTEMVMWYYDVPWDISAYSIDSWLGSLSCWLRDKTSDDVSRFKESKTYKEFFSET